MAQDWRVLRASTVHTLKHHPIFLSFYEAIFVFAVSNFALVFFIFAHVVSTDKEVLSWHMVSRVVTEAVSSTEIFVYILALIAPALWVMFYNWRARRHPLFYFTLLVLQALIIVGSAYIYGVAKFGKIENVEFVDLWASICYVLGLVIWYISLVYDKVLRVTEIPHTPPSGETILKELG